MSVEAADIARRFGGVSRLYGELGLQRFQAAHVCVIGIGGVGSWVVEALARNAIGSITLIDLDNIAESNVNRQLHAVDGAFGLAKVTAMAQRIHSINPDCQVHEIEDFITPENASTMLGNGYDVVIDAIDDTRAKVALAHHCRALQVPLVMTGAAGGRLDPTRIKVADLSMVYGDRLLAKVRNQLRRDHGFPKGDDSNAMNVNIKNTKTGNTKPGNTKTKRTNFGIQAVFSDEQVQRTDASCEVEVTTSDAASYVSNSITGLNCAGYGSSVCVTAPFGFAAAGLALALLLSAS